MILCKQNAGAKLKSETLEGEASLQN